MFISGADLEGARPAHAPCSPLYARPKNKFAPPGSIINTVAPPGSKFSGSAPVYIMT